MLKKTIKYTDYNGEEREEDFYFNLSKAEVMEMQLEMEGGFDTYIKNIVDKKDTPSIIKVFKSVILKAYGEKSADGKRFVKSEAMSEAFSQTEAYSVLFMELATNPEFANAFMTGILPVEVPQLPKN